MNALNNCSTTAVTCKEDCSCKEIINFDNIIITATPPHKSICPEGQGILEEPKHLDYCYAIPSLSEQCWDIGNGCLKTNRWNLYDPSYLISSVCWNHFKHSFVLSVCSLSFLVKCFSFLHTWDFRTSTCRYSKKGHISIYFCENESFNFLRSQMFDKTFA